MNKTLSLLGALFACTLLTACGGSSSGGGTAVAPSPTTPPNTTPPATTTPSYETLNSTAEIISTLGGVAFRVNETTEAIDVVTVSGSTTHSTGNTTISDGTYSLNDPDGFGGGNTLTDGTATLAVADSSVLQGTYDYVTVFAQDYTSGGSTLTSVGAGGVITSASDVPTGGTATYSGNAIGVIVNGSQEIGLTNGTSTVAADFAAGTVNATLTGFTARDAETDAVVASPIDTISATGMTIAGNGFSGGTVATTNGGVAVNVTGANTTSTAQGAFFGYDAAASAPDEVGGIVLQRGDDGVALGVFVAD